MLLLLSLILIFVVNMQKSSRIKIINPLHQQRSFLNQNISSRNHVSTLTGHKTTKTPRGYTNQDEGTKECDMIKEAWIKTMIQRHSSKKIRFDELGFMSKKKQLKRKQTKPNQPIKVMKELKKIPIDQDILQDDILSSSSVS